jgi:hypothetical protein
MDRLRNEQMANDKTQKVFQAFNIQIADSFLLLLDIVVIFHGKK